MVDINQSTIINPSTFINLKMIISKYPDFQQLNQLLQRPEAEDEHLEDTVSAILRRVKNGGDDALRELTERFDGAVLENLEVSQAEKNRAVATLPQALKEAIGVAARNIRTFHEAQREHFVPVETMPGVRCWRKSVPVGKVGIYIPGGSAPLFSTVLMLGIPAQLAGCQEVTLCTPPGRNGSVHPAILFAAEVAGVPRIFKVGGAQAIAAMAYGTESIPKADKIFGPGNRYVTCAKLLVQQAGVAIDLPAGPSEVLVFADDTAVPAFVAADLLSQAEHGADSQVVLLTTSEAMLNAVLAELETQTATLSRQSVIRQSLAHSLAVLLKNEDEALAAINFYAPEHLILACENAETLAERVSNAGSVFLGNYSPETAGDYASGTNHTLPTYGFARSYSGVSLDSFFKKITFQHISREGLRALGPTLVTLATAEELPAHARAVELRLEEASSPRKLSDTFPARG